MQSVTLNQFCIWKGDYYLTESVQTALEKDKTTTLVKRNLWTAIDHHFLKGNVDFTSIKAELIECYNSNFGEAGVVDQFSTILNLCENPEALRRYHFELKVLKVIAVIGALIFVASAILAFIKLHYNYLDIPISHLHLAAIGVGILALASIIRKCYKIQSSKTELHEAYDDLWRPFTDYLYTLPVKASGAQKNELEKLAQESIQHISEDFKKWHASVNLRTQGLAFEIPSEYNEEKA